MANIDSKECAGSSVEEWLKARLAASATPVEVKEALELLLDGQSADLVLDQGPFLTVVMRSQLKRWEQLQDALLCLAAQTDDDFEVVLMLHDVGSDAVERVSQLLEGFPVSFGARIKVLEVSGGGRSRPLNAALERFSARYVAFFDDDDLLMADWVESFRRGAEQAPGKLIRANVATQDNLLEVWEDGTSGQRTVGVAQAEYARSFNFLDNLERNHTPFMGFAFPRNFFVFWGERFDEELVVCEDWDIIMRAAQLLGVHSIQELTAIYRQWKNAQTSYTSHDLEEWRESERKVRQKLSTSPFLAPSTLASELTMVLAQFRDKERLMFQHQVNLVSSTTWRMMEPVRAMIRFARRQKPR